MDEAHSFMKRVLVWWDGIKTMIQKIEFDRFAFRGGRVAPINVQRIAMKLLYVSRNYRSGNLN